MWRMCEHRFPVAKVAVQVETDHLEKLTHASRRLGRVSELIWNALDAEAEKVTVRAIDNALEGVDAVEVIDNAWGT